MKRIVETSFHVFSIGNCLDADRMVAGTNGSMIRVPAAISVQIVVSYGL